MILSFAENFHNANNSLKGQTEMSSVLLNKWPKWCKWWWQQQ